MYKWPLRISLSVRTCYDALNWGGHAEPRTSCVRGVIAPYGGEGGTRLVTNEYQKRLGARLRAIRQQQGLTLQQVEEMSEGRWKAVVVGSYERGDRAVSV